PAAPTPRTATTPLSLHDALPILAQTSLPSDDGFSFTEPLEPVTRAFAELTPVVDDAAFEGYRALLQELVASVGLPSRPAGGGTRSEEHTSELQSRENLVCRLLLE